MQTTIHFYCFDTDYKEQKEAYEKLKTYLKSKNLKCFETWGTGCGHYFIKNKLFENSNQTSGLVELDTSSLFNNQWNTTNHFRVFDWAQDYIPKSERNCVKRGHYLDITQDIIDIRKNTFYCRYCGSKINKQDMKNAFCTGCIGSGYLKETDLNLLRLSPICDSHKKRSKLTEVELDYLLPIFITAQTKITGEKNRENLQKLKEEQNKKLKTMKIELDGYTWLTENNINQDNVIFYNHTKTFCFGWRGSEGLDKGVKKELKNKLVNFPFNYEIK